MKAAHIALSIACLSCAPVVFAALPGNPMQEEVKRELVRYYADFSARDWKAFADHFWKGGTIANIWTPPGEADPRVVVQSIPEFVAHAPEGPGSQPIFEETMTSVEIRVQGGLAQAWAGYHAKFGSPGNIHEWDGIDGFNLLKFGDRWRIVSLTFAPDR